MSVLPWEPRFSGTKRALAWWEAEPAEQRRCPRPRTTSRPPPETVPFFRGDGIAAGGKMLVVDAGQVGRRAQEREVGARGFDGPELRMWDFSSHTLNDDVPLSGKPAFGMLNDNVSLSGKFAFGRWLVQNRSILDGRRVLELKSGTGALASFLRKTLGVDITTSDSDDKEADYSMAYNCRSNNLTFLPHIRHTWGDPFPVSRPDWDIVIASDIELYAEQSPNLVKTLCFLLREYKHKDQKGGSTTITNKSGTQVPVKFPIALISWRQGTDPSALFLGCENEGLEVQHLGNLVYLIKTKN